MIGCKFRTASMRAGSFDAWRVSDEAVRVPILLSKWLTVTFVHWPVAPEVVQALLPAGLVVDRWDDEAWLTLAPFRMVDVGPPGPAALRRLTFAETNFRTYVRAPDGRAGIYFFAIEAVSALMTISARVAAGIPTGSAISVSSRTPGWSAMAARGGTGQVPTGSMYGRVRRLSSRHRSTSG